LLLNKVVSAVLDSSKPVPEFGSWVLSGLPKTGDDMELIAPDA
jgi:hypothetical protein